jgi:hypothetical protein
LPKVSNFARQSRAPQPRTAPSLIMKAIFCQKWPLVASLAKGGKFAEEGDFGMKGNFAENGVFAKEGNFSKDCEFAKDGEVTKR